MLSPIEEVSVGASPCLGCTAPITKAWKSRVGIVPARFCDKCAFERLMRMIDREDTAYIERLTTALNKINDIRNSIVGLQTMNWSEHIYPLVAALNEAGIEGMEYPEARENFGTLLERTNTAEAERNTLQQRLTAVREELRGVHETHLKRMTSVEHVRAMPFWAGCTTCRILRESAGQ